MKVELLVAAIFSALLATLAITELTPFDRLAEWRAKLKTQKSATVDFRNFEVWDKANGEEPFLTIEFLGGEHFWNPQVAIWLEDSVGNYLVTLSVTTTAAKGLFYAGRTAKNFRQFDGKKEAGGEEVRRVDALPYWSHKRSILLADGFYSPSPQQPLPDAITSATPRGNFVFKTGKLKEVLSTFRVMVELNVAFDENEYFSEYDYPDDSLYHGGAGLLGQPSLIYGATIQKESAHKHYILDLLGRGHHSGRTGELIKDLSPITTATKIADRITATVNFPN